MYILNSIKAHMGLLDEQTFITVDRHANCSSASIPIAISELIQHHKLSREDLLLFSSFGAGFTLGNSLVRW